LAFYAISKENVLFKAICKITVKEAIILFENVSMWIVSVLSKKQGIFLGICRNSIDTKGNNKMAFLCLKSSVLAWNGIPP
jgi:hypothetical protein